MKLTLKTIILFVLFQNTVFAQIQTDEIYEVINQLIEINKVESLNKTARPCDRGILADNGFVDWCTKTSDKRLDISDIDSTFIINQITDREDIKWDLKRIDKKIRLRKNPTDTFSIPVFLNPTKDLIIVYHFQYVGPTESEGKYELYRLIDNKWKLINVQLDTTS